MKKISYHEGLTGSNPYVYKWSLEYENVEEELKIEQGLYNALDALNCFFIYLVGTDGTDRKTPENEGEEDFRLTTIQTAKELQEVYIKVTNKILSRIQRDYSKYPTQFQRGDNKYPARFKKLEDFIQELTRRKETVERYAFDSHS